jgi:hypothetical protein
MLLFEFLSTFSRPGIAEYIWLLLIWRNQKVLRPAKRTTAKPDNATHKQQHNMAMQRINNWCSPITREARIQT